MNAAVVASKQALATLEEQQKAVDIAFDHPPVQAVDATLGISWQRLTL